MTKNREEKKQQLKRNLEDYKAFDGNEKEIEKIKRKLHEIEIEEEFEEYKKHRMEYLRIKAEHKKEQAFYKMLLTPRLCRGIFLLNKKNKCLLNW